MEDGDGEEEEEGGREGADMGPTDAGPAAGPRHLVAERERGRERQRASFRVESKADDDMGESQSEI